MNAQDPSVIPVAAERLEGVVHHTPIHTSRTLDEKTGATVFLKCENFQRVGAFKFRGAYNAVSQLPEDARARGVVTHSSGNHAQGLALAARLNRVPCTVVMPYDAPTVKRAATEGYGARLVPCDAKDREIVAARLVEEEGLTLVHPYDDPNIIAGAGTAAHELLGDVEDLDLLLTPVGGGGLVSGTCLAAAHAGGRAKVIGVEPSMADDAKRSFESGEIVTLPEVPPTIADGLRTRHIGELNLAVMRAHLQDLITVEDEEIREAMRFVWLRMKLVIEPSAAVPVAGLLTGKIKAPGQRVGIVISGGNVNPGELAELLRPPGARF